MKIVGVTACPTGIAHTYMSAEKLTITAEALGYEVKIETQGAKVENVLTKEDIATADYVILAVDKEIDTSRFAGKKIKKKYPLPEQLKRLMWLLMKLFQVKD